MIASLLLLPLLQDKLPADDHAWLRFKTGTWVRNVLTVKDVGFSGQGVQTLTLKERGGDRYTIEEESTLSVGGPSLHRRIDERTSTCVKLEGKITTARGTGTMTLWTSSEIPGAQVRLDIALDTPGGKVRFNVEPMEIHEEK